MIALRTALQHALIVVYNILNAISQGVYGSELYDLEELGDQRHGDN